ncbi:V-type ATPase, D subunit [Streptomyces sp. NA02950]|uniref:V-type ATP synthase subunit D n=1 Tax=Streptomyces sp. NA02950 TaxID=2742137 RepID=UPI00158FD167|nr:V-type ATP synthase subunit D [Streptomyces sp. NA02950]QKV90607.1 V-type ATPase, D subunit [Streptomyces sp. NA02950]
MTTASGPPPSRAGRLRVRHSLEVALRGAELLERKLRILRARHEALLRAEEAGAHAWRQRVRDAETWLLRGLFLGGEHALEAAAEGAGAADFTWREESTVGVRHPALPSCRIPDRSPDVATPGNTALVHAETAYRQVLLAGAEYAVARHAARIVGAEVARTRRRVRALRRHWIPRLEETLARINLALEEGEHEDHVRRHWAAGRRG